MFWLSALDIAALVWLGLCWASYAWMCDRSPRGEQGLMKLVHAYRERWLQECVARDNRMVDAALVNNLMRSVSFFASTSILAVDGLLNGAIAGVVMAIYLLLFGVAAGAGVAVTLSALGLGQGTSPVRGALIHLAVAAIYGMVFSLIYRLIGRGRSIGRGGNVLIGLAYGLLLWLITQIAFAAGINVALSSLSAVHFAVAHLAYGALLDWLASRTRAD